MKSFLFSLVLVAAVASQAKLNDFNALIEENTKAQKELHTTLKENLEETRVAVQETGVKTESRVVVDATNSINVPTSKKLLTYSKEKVYHRASESQNQKRLAQEIELAQ